MITPVDFVGGGNNNFYALNATTGTTIWHTLLGSQTGDYIWSSPAVFHNSVYIGESSFGDCPLVRGKVIQLNVSTGAIQHTFYTVPKGCLGATVWSSPTIDQANNIVYISTGNEGTCSTSETLSDALVALRTTDLSLVSSWHVCICLRESRNEKISPHIVYIVDGVDNTHVVNRVSTSCPEW